ncbi:uncharacterized protein LOC112905744 [Agrilus planipennis]|uniref:Uncharacterized protein LOC112905744 n=1 Tax=Agrilus planipennis TaxID=224129 RepID=A0A7F5RF65_AGRPL|nr:uncharacterized protein LOC112905744 [Agrilus planipennis]
MCDEQKRVTRSQKKSSSEANVEQISNKNNQGATNSKEFRPTHSSTTTDPFTPQSSLSRSPPRQSPSIFTFELPEVYQAPNSNSTQLTITPTPTYTPQNAEKRNLITQTPRSPTLQINQPQLQKTLTLPTPQKPRTNSPNEIMQNTTLSNAFAETKQPATPKFIPPPTFDPSSDSALTFLSKYDRTAACNGWTDTYKIVYFGSFLEGPANIWYNEYIKNEQNRENDWEQIKNDFKREFNGEQPMRKLKFKFQNRKQRDNEDLKRYYYDLLCIAHEIDTDMPFETFRDQFENGLHSSFAETYYLFSNGITTFDELKKLVLRLSEVRERVLNDRMTAQTTSTITPTHGSRSS